MTEQQARAERQARIANREYLRKAKEQREIVAQWVIIALVALVALVAVGTEIHERFIADDQYTYTETTTYYVEKGDTLWSVAGDYSTEAHDIRVVIEDIKELSFTNANLQVGQKLVIPLYEACSE